MSWNYLFTLEFDEDETASDRFLRIVRAISESAIFNHALPLRLETSNGRGQKTDLNLGQRSKNIDAFDLFRKIADAHYREDVTFTLTYNMPIYVQLWDDDLPARQKNYRQFIVEGFAGFGIPTRCTYNAGDARHYREGHTQRLNLGLLLKELLFMVEGLNVRTIRGLNVHRDVEPHRHSVVFHRELDGFLLDVYDISGEFYGINERTRELVLDAIFAPETNLRIEETNDLPILLSQDGSTGNLRTFFERLLTLLQVDQRLE